MHWVVWKTRYLNNYTQCSRLTYDKGVFMKSYPFKCLIIAISVMIILISGCAKSQLKVAEFIRPPSKILRFRDIHTIQIQQPSISISSSVSMDRQFLKMYEKVIQDSFLHAFSHKPWYQIGQSCSTDNHPDNLEKQIQKNGLKWINPVPSESENNRQHRLFSTINIIRKQESGTDISLTANMSIVILDAQDKEIYVQLFNNLLATVKKHEKNTFTEKLCIHHRLANQLFQPAVEKVVEAIYPRTIKQVMSIHDDSDMKCKLLLAAEGFPEALAHIKQSIKEKERIYIQEKNKILKKYQQIESNLETQNYSDEEIREKRIELAKEKESKIDQERKLLSGDYNNYGTALEALGFIDEAAMYYEKAFTADPFNYLARLAFHRLIYFRKTSNKELELNQETIELPLRRQNESL